MAIELEHRNNFYFLNKNKNLFILFKYIYYYDIKFFYSIKLTYFNLN